MTKQALRLASSVLVVLALGPLVAGLNTDTAWLWGLGLVLVAIAMALSLATRFVASGED